MKAIYYRSKFLVFSLIMSDSYSVAMIITKKGVNKTN